MILLVALAPLAGARAQSPVTVGGVSIRTREDVTTVLISTSAPAQYHVSRLDAPPRLVLDLPDAISTWRDSPLVAGGDAVKEVRSPPRAGRSVRIEIELAHPSDYLIERAGDRLRVMLPAPEPPAAGARATAAASPPDGSAQAPSLKGIARTARGWVAYLEDPRARTVAGYRVGDTTAGRTVEAIERDRVVLDGHAGRLEMHLDDAGGGTIQHRR